MFVWELPISTYKVWTLTLSLSLSHTHTLYWKRVTNTWFFFSQDESLCSFESYLFLRTRQFFLSLITCFFCTGWVLVSVWELLISAYKYVLVHWTDTDINLSLSLQITHGIMHCQSVQALVEAVFAQLLQLRYKQDLFQSWILLQVMPSFFSYCPLIFHFFVLRKCPISLD